MGVSLNYRFEPARPLDQNERGELLRLVSEANAAEPSTAEPIEFFEAGGDGTEQWHGSSKLPLEGADIQAWLQHALATLSTLRRRFPEADWEVDLEEAPVDWDEGRGFSLPGLDDPAVMGAFLGF
ncbi:MAG: hypothetical protein LBE25_08705 [Arthrobacter sp.]|jgi:hypothetical protein|nr:hypothetical protein [Arthrobacter sp.]